MVLKHIYLQLSSFLAAATFTAHHGTQEHFGIFMHKDNIDTIIHKDNLLAAEPLCYVQCSPRAADTVCCWCGPHALLCLSQKGTETFQVDQVLQTFVS
jgi:hypothetical protein